MGIKTIYISGPMVGYHNLNYNAFLKMEEFLLNKGYYIRNPLDLEVDEKFQFTEEPTRQDYYRKDIRALTYCDEIMMLKGWQMSHGAQLERQIAFEMGLTVRYEEEIEYGQLKRKNE